MTKARKKGAKEAKPRGFQFTYKQEAFINEYIVDLNATQAAIRAGYSEDTAGSIGHELLKKPEIRQAIQKAMDSRAERTKITADRVLNELGKIGFSDVRKILAANGNLRDLIDVDDDTAAAIQSVELVTRNENLKDDEGNRPIEYVHKIRFADKKGSLELLGKHLKIFDNRDPAGEKGNVSVHIHLSNDDTKLL
jgi:phage terminase small subunit